jgi:hypothetical protein
MDAFSDLISQILSKGFYSVENNLLIVFDSKLCSYIYLYPHLWLELRCYAPETIVDSGN